MKKRWDLSHLYKSTSAWKKDKQNLESKMNSFKANLEQSFIVEEIPCYLRNLFDLYEIMEPVYCYPRRILDIKDNNEEAQGMMKEALAIFDHYLELENMIKKEIIHHREKIDLDCEAFSYWAIWLKQVLKKANHVSDDANMEKQIWNEKLERTNQYTKIMNQLSFPSILIEGEEKEITLKNVNHFLKSESESIRRQTYASYMEGYKRIEEEVAVLYLKKLKLDIDFAKSCHYENLAGMKMEEHGLKSDFLNTLFAMIDDHIYLAHDFERMRKNASNLSEMHLYDFSLGNVHTTKKYTFKEAYHLVRKSLSILGEDYLLQVDDLLEKGAFDIFPRDHKQKRSSTSLSYKGLPYVMLNFTGDITSVKTLAHEIGHAMNVEYSKGKNKIEYFDVDFLLTEIASHVNEVIFYEYCLKNTDEDQKRVLGDIASELKNSIFQQVMLMEFEDNIIKDLEREKEVTVSSMNSLYLSLLEKYYGKDICVDECCQYGWLRIRHFLTQDSYYLYLYSIGTLVGTEIALRILSGEKGIVEKYKMLLAVGNTMTPEEALNLVGIDLYDKEYAQNTFDYFKKTVKELEKRSF